MHTCRLLSCLMVAALLATVHAAETAPAQPEPNAPAKEAKKKSTKPRVILGRVEYVVVRDIGVKLKARVDTGAGVSSVHAKILEIKQIDEGERVHFEIEDVNGNAKSLWRDVVGWANIKVMNSDERSRRPIVRLSICLGGKKLKGRVNLNDRGEFLYPMLIGRNLLNTGKFLVDPSRKYLQDPGCE